MKNTFKTTHDRCLPVPIGLSTEAGSGVAGMEGHMNGHRRYAPRTDMIYNILCICLLYR